MTADVSGPMLRATDVTVALGGRDVLSGVTLDVTPGELIAVIGANGAGKSTLLKTMAGLISPSRGRVTINDELLDAMPARDIARRIAYLPQDRVVHWSMPCEAVVALGRLPHRSFASGPSPHDRDVVKAAMQRMDVIQFSQRPIAALSGGERARVLVARALAQGARFLIADEPTAGLDPAHCLNTIAEFVRLAHDKHAVITSLHDLSLAARFATRIMLLKKGRCIASGPPAHVLSKQNLAAAFGIEAEMTVIGGNPVVVVSSPLT